MDDRLTDIFGPVEENSDDSVEEEEEPKEEQEKDEISSIFEEEGEVDDDKPNYDEIPSSAQTTDSQAHTHRQTHARDIVERTRYLRFVYANREDDSSKYTLGDWRRLVTLGTCSSPSSAARKMLSRSKEVSR